MRSGGTPNLAFTPSTSSRSLVMVLIKRDLGVDQLRQVLVAGGNHHLVPAGRGLRAPACRWRRRPRCRAPPAPASRAGARPRGWARSAAPAARASARAGPCTRVPVVAEGRALGVEDAGRMLGRVALAQPLHHRHHAVHGAGGKTVAGAQVGHRVVGAVEVAGAVHQQHDLLAHAGHCGAPAPRPRGLRRIRAMTWLHRLGPGMLLAGMCRRRLVRRPWRRPQRRTAPAALAAAARPRRRPRSP